MKKLLIPLIILLLIIGYFMSRGGDHKAKDAYDSMEQPKSEQQMDDMSTPPDDTTTPPDGMGTPDTQMPQESDETDTTPPGGMMGEAEDAAKDAGEAMEDAAKKAGETVEEAVEKTGEALEDAGDAAKKAAEDAADKLRGEDSNTDDEPQG